MALSIKGDPVIDEEFRAAADRLHALFWKHWRQMDYETALHVTQIIIGLLPKLFEISHTRGKQGHGRR